MFPITVSAQELTTDDLKEIASSTAKSYGLNTEHFQAVIGCESNWDITATSTTGDYGIAQWNKKYHPELSDEQISDPYSAIDLMAKAWKAGHASWWVCYNSIYGKRT